MTVVFPSTCPVRMRRLIVPRRLKLPAGVLKGSNWSSTVEDALSWKKKEQQKTEVWSTDDVTDSMPATLTKTLFIPEAAVTITQVTFRVGTLPTSSRINSVDIQKESAKGSGSFSSIQSGTINQASSDTANTEKDSPGITGGSVVAGAAVRLVITNSGSGSHAIDPTVIVVYEENPF